jgi:hypothetical protein
MVVDETITVGFGDERGVCGPGGSCRVLAGAMQAFAIQPSRRAEQRAKRVLNAWRFRMFLLRGDPGARRLTRLMARRCWHGSVGTACLPDGGAAVLGPDGSDRQENPCMSASSIWRGSTRVSLTSFRHRPMPRRPPSPPTAPRVHKPQASRRSTRPVPRSIPSHCRRQTCRTYRSLQAASHLRAQAEDDGPVRDTGSGRTQVEHDHHYDHACDRITDSCQYPQAARTIVSASNNERRGPLRPVKPPTQAEQILWLFLERQEEAAGKGSRHRCRDTWRLDDRLGRQAAGEGKGDLEKIWSGRRDSNPRPQPWQGWVGDHFTRHIGSHRGACDRLIARHRLHNLKTVMRTAWITRCVRGLPW